MIISKTVFKNKVLASQVWQLLEKIDKLEAFRKSIDDLPGHSNLKRSTTRLLNRSKKGFAFINDAYDEDAHLKVASSTGPFVGETKEWCDDIEDFLFRASRQR